MTTVVNKPVALYYSSMCYQAENLDYLEQHFEIKTLADPSEDSDQLLSDAVICFAPLGYMFDAGKMDRCQQLKVIISNTTGVPHIDMDAAEKRGITVCSLKDEQDFLDSITPTAEHTWGLLLAVMRHTVAANRDVLNGRWNRRPFGGNQMLSRMSLGVVGYGRLGRRVAKYGHAFGMPVRYYDPYADSDDIAARVDSLMELAAWADVLSLHVVANDETAGLISAEILENCKPGMLLINTARGELIDESALLRVLRSGRMAAAALDVIDGEFAPDFVPADHPLIAYAREHDNLLLTPHIGGSTLDAWFETERRVIDMALSCLAGMRK